MKMLAFRLLPGTDLKQGIEEAVKANDLKSGFIMTCVGSLSTAVIRMAGAQPEHQDIRTITDDLEIVSLVGTLSQSGAHLHISVSDRSGVVIGGHLKSGAIIATTAEVVIGYDESITFNRSHDPATGFDELQI